MNNPDNTFQKTQDYENAIKKALGNEDVDVAAKELNNVFVSQLEENMNNQLQELENIKKEFEATQDKKVLESRGIRQLTNEEKKYYENLADSLKYKNSTTGMGAVKDEAIPTTIIDRVFEDLKKEHPLLNHIDIKSSQLITRDILSLTNGSATWSELCAPITAQLDFQIFTIETNKHKLSCYVAICNALLDLGPEYLDKYIRELIAEELSVGVEDGIVNGNGQGTPVGMIRSSVLTEFYPKNEKDIIPLTSFEPSEVGKLLANLTQKPVYDEYGTQTNETNQRVIHDVIFIMNPYDYFSKVFGATTLLLSDGSYKSNVVPFNITFVQSTAVEKNKAIMGIGKNYSFYLGVSPTGKTVNNLIESSSEAKFLEDVTVFKSKVYGNGCPKDDNSFLYLDITDLQPLVFPVKNVADTTAVNTQRLLMDTSEFEVDDTAIIDAVLSNEELLNKLTIAISENINKELPENTTETNKKTNTDKDKK